MLRLSGIEFIARLVPESLLFIFATNAFSNTRINYRRYMQSVVILAASVFIIRMLPISYGVHTILNIIALTVITIGVNRLEVIQGTKGAIMTSMLLFALEGINMGILKVIFGDDMNSVMSSPVLKTIYGIPSLICFAAITFIYYFRLKKKGKLKDA